MPMNLIYLICCCCCGSPAACLLLFIPGCFSKTGTV